MDDQIIPNSVPAPAPEPTISPVVTAAVPPSVVSSAITEPVLTIPEGMPDSTLVATVPLQTASTFVAPPVSVPPTPAPEPTQSPAQHEAMGQYLTQAIQTGKHEIPESPAPLVCKPAQLESWRVFKIMSEFVSGFELIGKYGLAASFFGTSRESFDQKYYADATDLAARLAKDGYAVITGGSAGVMEAANKGAYDAGGASIGLNINLETHQGLNKYLTDSESFDHFFVRKVMLAFSSDVYIYFPGGFGTLDEFTEIITLVQTKKIRPIPIVLYGVEYWTPLIEFFKNYLLDKYHAISEEDMNLFYLAKDVDDAYAYIKKNVTSC